MNIVTLVGRLTRDIEIKESNGKKLAKICLAVRRDFKNSDGEYDTDFLNVTLWEGYADLCSDFCRKGVLISMKGRLVTDKWEQADGSVINTTGIIGEKIQVLSYPKQESEA